MPTKILPKSHPDYSSLKKNVGLTEAILKCRAGNITKLNGQIDNIFRLEKGVHEHCKHRDKEYVDCLICEESIYLKEEKIEND